MGGFLRGLGRLPGLLRSLRHRPKQSVGRLDDSFMSIFGIARLPHSLVFFFLAWAFTDPLDWAFGTSGRFGFLSDTGMDKQYHESQAQEWGKPEVLNEGVAAKAKAFTSLTSPTTRRMP